MIAIKADKWTSNLIPKELRTAVRKLGHIVCSIAPSGWIAGGAIRSRLANDGESDLDVYFTNSKMLAASKYSILNDNELNASIKHEDDTVLTLNSTLGKIDLVKRYYSDPAACIDDFDFTVCMFAIRHDYNVYWTDQAIEHIQERKLVLHHPTCPLSTMMRLQKYGGKGYTMDVENHTRLAELIKERDIKDTALRLSKRAEAYPPMKKEQMGLY